MINDPRLDPESITELDPGIRDYVLRLRDSGVETYESCQGGPGHCYPEPTIMFHGQRDAGFSALSIAQCFGLPVQSLARVWRIEDGEPTGPSWQMVFRPEQPASPFPWWWSVRGPNDEPSVVDQMRSTEVLAVAENDQVEKVSLREACENLAAEWVADHA